VSYSSTSDEVKDVELKGRQVLSHQSLLTEQFVFSYVYVFCIMLLEKKHPIY